jgi:hypothetical protein
MKSLFALASYLALALVIVPPFLFMLHTLPDLDTVKRLMLVGTVLWFVVSPFWLKKQA